MKKLNTVDDYIAKHSDRIDELILLRNILVSFPLKETIKWGSPVYTVNGKNVIGLGAFKSYVGLWFFQGVYLSDKYKVLVNAQEGKTKAMRQWRFSSVDQIKEEEVIDYVKEAIINQKRGLEVKPEKREVTMPIELEEYLAENSALKLSFDELAPFKQKEYCEYIATAKRPETKQDRLQNIAPLILVGKGLNDRYR